MVTDVTQATFQTPVEGPKTFHSFGILPVELRLRIWKLTSSRPRNVEIRAKHLPNENSDLPGIEVAYSSMPPPSVLHTCRESRAEGLKYYTLAFDGLGGRFWACEGSSLGIYINCEIDRICILDPILVKHKSSIESLVGIVKKIELKHLAVGVDCILEYIETLYPFLTRPNPDGPETDAVPQKGHALEELILFHSPESESDCGFVFGKRWKQEMKLDGPIQFRDLEPSESNKDLLFKGYLDFCFSDVKSWNRENCRSLILRLCRLETKWRAVTRVQAIPREAWEGDSGNSSEDEEAFSKFGYGTF